MCNIISLTGTVAHPKVPGIGVQRDKVIWIAKRHLVAPGPNLNFWKLVLHPIIFDFANNMKVPTGLIYYGTTQH